MMDQTQLRRFGLFDARVPRYTSYPTAPHFTRAVGPTVFGNWLERVPSGANVSLYLHIPFCRRLCWFCACRTQGTQSSAPVAAYVAQLKREIGLVARRLPDGVRLSRLHWGGGTPTLLSPELICDLADTIRQSLPFAEGAEFSVEIDPTELDQPRVDALKSAGMTRASIGIQDFDPLIQKTIGRAQSYDITRDSVDALRRAGISSLNADLVYGLPHQTRARIIDTVERLMTLHPDRVALFGYAHVPWMAKRQQLIPTESLPSAEERLSLAQTAARLFDWNGYTRIGIDHFALPGDGLAVAARCGRLRRNFQGYTDDPADVLIGLGASAISRFPWGYAQNAVATSAWAKAVQTQHLATERGYEFDGDDRLRGRMIEALMCDFQINRAEMKLRFGTTDAWLDEQFSNLNAAFEGHLQIDETGLTLPPDMHILARMVAQRLDAFVTEATAHSSAV